MHKQNGVEGKQLKSQYASVFELANNWSTNSNTDNSRNQRKKKKKKKTQ